VSTGEETTPESGLEDPRPVTRRGPYKSKNDAHIRTVRLPDGEIFEVELGWNALPQGGRVFLRRDGSVMYDSAPPVKTPQAADGGTELVPQAPPEVAARYRGKRGYSWPQAEPGNTLAVKHGATSPRQVEPLAAELVATTLAAAPFLAEPSFQPAVQAWARAEARCALLATYFDEHGLLDAQGNPRPATKLMTSLESLALKLRTRLGLDAASRAGIESSLTSTAVSRAALETALSAGQAILRERLERNAAAAEVAAS
jgi:hypothetical protein